MLCFSAFTLYAYWRQLLWSTIVPHCQFQRCRFFFLLVFYVVSIFTYAIDLFPLRHPLPLRPLRSLVALASGPPRCDDIFDRECACVRSSGRLRCVGCVVMLTLLSISVLLAPPSFVCFAVAVLFQCFGSLSNVHIACKLEGSIIASSVSTSPIRFSFVRHGT